MSEYDPNAAPKNPQCRRCLMLEIDVDAANRELVTLREIVAKQSESIQELRKIVNAIGYASCDPSRIDTTKSNQV